MNERELFLAALEIEDPAARQAHLQSACGGDAALQSRVEALLASHENASAFLQTPVGEQLGNAAESGTAATLVVGNGGTHDSDASPDSASQEEIPLGFLQPSVKPESLGRLDHYEILQVIGRGAFGIVLRAFDDRLQRVVAIKVLAPELASTSPPRKRFLREAQASAAIRHENVVSVYAVEEKPLPFLVMEFIPGVTLQQRLDETGPLDLPTVLRLGTQIAEGLAAAHAKDLIHRDIKPGNILLETGMRDRVKITDFGLARAADDASLTQSGVIAGTPMYMAPEQALGHKLDQRADLFSFGSVLYQMVSGRPPFRASSTLAVLKRLTEETPRPIQEIIPETPGWLCDVISKLHAKNPDDRFQTAKEVAELLDLHLAHLQNPSQISRPATVPAKPSTGSMSVSPEMRPLMVPQGIRWPLLIASAIMLLLAVLLFVVTESTGVTQLFSGPDAAHLTSPPIVLNPELASREDWRPGQWVQLFNRKDLTGWKSLLGNEADWTWADGVLTAKGEGDVLVTDRTNYENSHLRLSIKSTSDSGAWVRYRDADKVDRHGYFSGIRPAESGSNTHVGGGLMVWRNNRETGLAKDAVIGPAGEWHTLEIITVGNRIQTFVNGKPVADVTDSDNTFLRGSIALSFLGRSTQEVHFKNVEIKELPPTDVGSAQRKEPPPSSPRRPVLLRAFDPAKDKPIAPRGDQKNITVEDGGWRIENALDHSISGNFNVFLGTVIDDIPADGVLVLRAKVKLDPKHKNCWGDLMLGDGSPDGYDWPQELSTYRGEITEWTEKEVRYPVEIFRRKNPPSVPVYVGLHANGVLWVKDLELLHIPTPPTMAPPAALQTTPTQGTSPEARAETIQEK